MPAITTTEGSDWRSKVKEIKELGLKKVAIFPTCLAKEQRKEMYGLLEKSGIGEIPFVHLRGDMEFWELNYLIKKYSAQAFNIHSARQHPVFFDYSKYRDILYLENTRSFNERELRKFAGICLDFAHLENERRLNKEGFEKRIAVLEKYKIGCNHISSLPDRTHHDKEYGDIYDVHNFKNFSEFDYLKNYPERYFSNFIAMELENSLKEQLKAIDYIIGLIGLISPIGL